MAIITKAFMKMIKGHVDKFRVMDSNVGKAFSKKCSSSITRQFAGAVADEEFVKFILFVQPLRIAFFSCQQSLPGNLKFLRLPTTRWYGLFNVNTNYIHGYLSPNL